LVLPKVLAGYALKGKGEKVLLNKQRQKAEGKRLLWIYPDAFMPSNLKG
jgi:hypothetical protein